MSDAERYFDIWRAAYPLGYCVGRDAEEQKVIQSVMMDITSMADERYEELTGMTVIDAILKQQVLPLEV